VEGAQAPDEVDGVDADHFAVREATGDDVEGVAVVAVVEGGDKDERVGDVEVGVAGGEALAFEDYGRWHGEFDRVEGLVFEVAEAAEAVEVFGEGKMVFVAGVGLDAGEDFIFADEAGDVVDVAVGVVAGAALVEPEDFFDAEVGLKGLFEVFSGFGFGAEAGVAFLNFGEEALLSGEEEAGAVGIDAAAFEDQAVGFGFGIFGVGVDLGLELGDVVVAGDVLGDLVVAAPVVVLGPGVELPVGDGEVACGVFDEDGAGVAEPDAIGLPLVKVEAGEVGSGSAEVADGAIFGVGIVDQDVDGFDLGEVADDFGVDPGDGLEFSGPVFGVVGPRDPGGGVGGPLGRHAVVGWLVVGAAQWVPPYPSKVCKVFQ
jgi:hypothetical protein